MLRPLALWLAFLLLAAPFARAGAPCDEWVALGATPGEDSGIGGTGRAGGDESGIGGTGIYGTITQFGSVCVNGVRVHFGTDTPVTINGRTTSADALQIGHVVWIRAHADGGRLRASDIAVHSAVVGPVSAVDAAAGHLVVSDRAVRIGPDTRLVDRATGTAIVLGSIAPGDVVDVSGVVRRNGSIAATRITRRARDWQERYLGPSLDELVRGTDGIHHLSIEGFARFGPSAELIAVAGMRVDASALAASLAPPSDARVWLRGTLSPEGAVRADSVSVHVPPPAPDALPLAPEPRVPEPRPPVKRIPLGATDQPELLTPPRSESPPEPPPRVRPLPIPRPEPTPAPVPEPKPIEPEPTQDLQPTTVDRP